MHKEATKKTFCQDALGAAAALMAGSAATRKQTQDAGNGQLPRTRELHNPPLRPFSESPAGNNFAYFVLFSFFKINFF